MWRSRRDAELLTVQLEEYKALKAELLELFGSARRIVSLALTAMGVLIAVIPYVLQSKITIVFLVSPVLFYALALTSLKYILHAQDLVRYISENTIPALRRALNSTSNDGSPGYAELMTWDRIGRTPVRSMRGRLVGLLVLPIAGANYAVPVLGAAFSLTVFTVVTLQLHSALSLADAILLIVDTVGFVYCLIAGFIIELRR
jgi:hypothetical protein